MKRNKRRQPWTTICKAAGKRRFRDEIAAKLALASRIKRASNSRRPKNESRVYPCRSCRGWHMTSQEKRE